MDDWIRSPKAVGLVIVSFKLSRFYAIPWPFWSAAEKAWAEKGSKPCPKVKVTAYGYTWTTPGMASASPEQLLPEWEIRPTGDSVALPYLDIIDNFRRRPKE
ncbi:MAG: hypothetical protein ACI4HO_08870 [Ruminococcus sp.]